METIHSKTPENFADLATQWCNGKIAQYKAKRVFLPSGGTPKALYEKWEAEHPDFLNGLELTQLDEVISGKQAGCFREFFKTNLPTYFSQFVPLEKQDGLPDLVVLGLGVNGHVAFHEPHVPKSFFKGVVELEEDTCRRMGEAPGVKGLSYGIDCFMRAKAILIMIDGSNKEDVTRDLLQNPNSKIPAAYLRSHPDLTVIVSH